MGMGLSSLISQLQDRNSFLAQLAIQRNIPSTARWVSALLLLGIFIDYSGTFGIKLLLGVLVIGWVLMFKSSRSIILRNHQPDILVLLIIPFLLGAFHFLMLILNPAPGGDILHYGPEFYHTTISSAVLIFLFPLFYSAGSHAVMRQIAIGFRCVAVAILIIFALHVTGVISIGYGTAVMAFLSHFGAIGPDPRLINGIQLPQITARIAFPMPFAFGWELAGGIFWPLMMFVSLLAVGSRGLLLGVILLALLWIWTQRAKRTKILITRVLPLTLLFLIVVAIFPPIRIRFYDAFVVRTLQIFQFSQNAPADFTTQVRFGHIEGYFNLMRENPWMLMFGAGPTAIINNPYVDYEVTATEISFLTIMLWFGIPYAILYTTWLFRGAWKLWVLRKAPGFTKRDLGMILGAVIFWITANINPQLTTPFAIMAYMLLIVRRKEILAGLKLSEK